MSAPMAISYGPRTRVIEDALVPGMTLEAGENFVYVAPGTTLSFQGPITAGPSHIHLATPITTVETVTQTFE